MHSRSGFTLIELMMVVVIIGLLAAIALPKYQNTRARALVATMRSDLRSMALAEESYYYDNSTYTGILDTLNFNQSNGVTIQINEATINGWSATTEHLKAAGAKCYYYYGTAAPVGSANAPGSIACN